MNNIPTSSENTTVAQTPLIETSRRKQVAHFCNMVLLVGAAVSLIFALFAHTQFLAHNTIMTFQHKVLLYGLYGMFTISIFGYMGLQILHGLNREEKSP